MKFHPAIEHDPLIRRIEGSLADGRVSHAYLVEGPADLDLPDFARSFAKGILCPDSRGEECGKCPICDKIDHDNHEDLIYIRREGTKRSIGIDQVRGMQGRIAVKPNGPRYIVIIEECDLMTEEAQNCLLKTLEEPPGQAVLILLTENSERLLATIRSRCVKYRFESSAQITDGETFRRASLLLDQVLGRSPFYQAKKTLGKGAGDRAEAIRLIDGMEERCRQMILSRNKSGVLYSPAEISRCIDALEKARAQLGSGLAPGYVMKRFLLIIGG